MTKLIPIVALSVLFTAACVEPSGEDTGSAVGAIACATNDDCPSGNECQLEHGEGLCKPHGGDDGQGGTDDNGQGGDDLGQGGDDNGQGGDDLGGGQPQGECQSDLDCPAGEQCELEHGSSFCKPHGGN